MCNNVTKTYGKSTQIKNIRIDTNEAAWLVAIASIVQPEKRQSSPKRELPLTNFKKCKKPAVANAKLTALMQWFT